jgi:hypothetical protein
MQRTKAGSPANTPIIPVILFLISLSGAARAQGSSLEPWTFREDFSHGIPGWVSYPLSQDVGYDPSVYTKDAGGAPVLVRDVISYGQKRLRVGLVRPLRFHADPASSFRIGYSFESCGKTLSVRLILGTVDGRRYSASILSPPAEAGQKGGGSPGEVRVEGQQLQVPSAGADIEAIVLEAEVAAPAPGGHSVLTLRGFEIQAQRPARIPLRAPALVRSVVDGDAVAQEVLTAGSPLKLDLGAGPAARIVVRDASGAVAHSEDVAGGDTRPTQFAAPDQPGLYQAETSSGPAKSDFRFLVLGKVLPHPRVLLTPERLAQLRSQSYSHELAVDAHRRAVESRKSLAYNPQAGRNIELLPTISVHPGLEDYFALLGNYSRAIAFNALDFRLNGDRESLDAARRALLTVSAWPTWTPPWFTANGLHNYYGAGVFTQSAAFGYDLIADELVPEDKAQIAQAFWEKSIRPALEGYFTYDRLPIAPSNHESQTVGGAIEACVAFYGDVPDWQSKFGPALAQLIVAYERMIRGLFPGDGSEAEPAGYEHFAMEGMSWGMGALHALNVRPRGFDKMMQSFWWLRYVQVRPDLVLDTGDTGTTLTSHSGFAWGAEYSGDPALAAFYGTATEASLEATLGKLHAEPTAARPYGLLDLVCCSQPAPAPSEPPLSRIFPGRGSAALRSGWGPDDTVISLRVGPWFNHEHHDQGSFLVAAFGEELVAEAGYAHYYTDPHYQDYFTQAPGHNTVLVDGDPFSQEDYDGPYWAAFRNSPSIGSHVFSSGIDYLEAHLAPAYADASQVQGLNRDYLFLKPDILIVHDRIEAAVPHTYTWMLHVPPGSRTSITAAQAVIRRKAAFATLTAGGENSRWTLTEQPLPANIYGDFDHTAVDPRQAFRLESPRSRQSSFLVGLRFQKAGDAPAPLDPFSSTSGQGFQTPGGAAQVVFRSKPGPLTASGLSTDGDLLAVTQANGATEIFATHLKSLQRGGQLLASSSAPADLARRETPDAVEVHVQCSALSNLKIYAAKTAREVMLDQGAVNPSQAVGLISLEHLAKGEHVIKITY